MALSRRRLGRGNPEGRLFRAASATFEPAPAAAVDCAAASDFCGGMASPGGSLVGEAPEHEEQPAAASEPPTTKVKAAALSIPCDLIICAPERLRAWRRTEDVTFEEWIDGAVAPITGAPTVG